MWSCNKVKDEEAIRLNKRKEDIEKLRKFRDIGGKFQYCGKECLVESLTSSRFGFPQITAAYKTDLGEIKYLYFEVKHLPALISENK